MLRSTTIFVVLFGLIASASAQVEIPSDSRLKAISERQVIRIAYRDDATPFSFVNDKKEPVGYTIDLCKLAVDSIRQQFGLSALKIEWVPVTVHTRFSAVADGKADMECGSSTVTLGRMEQVDFSNFVFVERTAAVVRRDANIRTFADLNGKKIAVIAGTSNENAIVGQIRARKLDTATMIAVKDREEGFALLEAGKADAYASDMLLLVGAQKQHPEALAMLAEHLSIEPYAIALPRGDWAFRLAVNRALAQTYRSGKIGEVFARWFERIGLPVDGFLTAAFIFGGLAD